MIFWSVARILSEYGCCWAMSSQIRKKGLCLLNHFTGCCGYFFPPANEVCEGYVLHLSVSHSAHIGTGLQPAVGVCIQGGLHSGGILHSGGGESASREEAVQISPCPIGYYEIRSTRGRYAFYCNAFLLSQILLDVLSQLYSVGHCFRHSVDHCIRHSVGHCISHWVDQCVKYLMNQLPPNFFLLKIWKTRYRRKFIYFRCCARNIHLWHR